MKKKVIYVNSATGKEVKYGEQITFKEQGKFKNGYSYFSEITLPVINPTIPDLIEKGILVQKEIVENNDSSSKDKSKKITIDEKLNYIANAIVHLTEEFEDFKKCYGCK